MSCDFLIVSSDTVMITHLTSWCERLQYKSQVAHNTEEAFACVGSTRFGTILFDALEKERGGLRFLEWLRTLWLSSQIGVFARHEEELDEIPLARLQLDDSFIASDDENWIVHKLSALALRGQAHTQVVWQEWKDTEQKRHTSVRWYPEVFLAIQKTHALVHEPFLFLVTGEKGVGKNLLAQTLLIHASCRISLTTTGLDADSQKEFLFSQLIKLLTAQQERGQALRVAIIIEDVENLLPELQQFFEDYFRTGQCEVRDQTFSPTLQLVATSAEPLERLMLSGRMNSDLLVRFSSQSLAVQPLRERRQDIVHLVDLFIHEWEKTRPVRFLSLDTLEALIHYDWPGNAAELKSVLETLLSATDEAAVTAKNLPPQVLQKTFYCSADETADYSELSYAEAKKRMLHKFHRAYISELLKKSQNNLTVAAEKAQLDRSNFKKVMKKFGCS